MEVREGREGRFGPDVSRRNELYEVAARRVEARVETMYPTHLHFYRLFPITTLGTRRVFKI